MRAYWDIHINWRSPLNCMIWFETSEKSSGVSKIWGLSQFPWLIGEFNCVPERINRYEHFFRKVVYKESSLRILLMHVQGDSFFSFRTPGRPNRLIRPRDLGFFLLHWILPLFCLSESIGAIYFSERQLHGRFSSDRII